MTDKTFAQTVYEAAGRAADSEAGKSELIGMNREQFVATVRAITSAMDTLPVTTSMNMMLLSLSYIRNAIIVTMQHNQKVMEAPGGTPS
jgi:hypothetical protein